MSTQIPSYAWRRCKSNQKRTKDGMLNSNFNEPRVQSYVPKEETFPIPLKYIDVTRSTHIDLDVLQHKRIDDFWNVDSSRHLSNTWRGFTKITLLKEKPPKGYMWSGRRLTKIQTTTRPDHVRPEVWTKNGKAAQNREKQEWAKEEPQLDNARKMKGIYFIDPDDEEYKEVLKNARTKLEAPMAPAMPCARQKSITNVVAKPNSASEENSKTMYSCFVESHESTRQRAESSQSKTP